MPEIIYYTGIGAKKSGKHTPNEFTKIMNKHFDVDCSTRLARHKIPSCKKFSKMVLSRLESIKVKPKLCFGVRVGMRSLVNPSKKSSNKNSTKAKQLARDCDRQVRKSLKHSKHCNLEEYIKYSGAEKKNS